MKYMAHLKKIKRLKEFIPPNLVPKSYEYYIHQINKYQIQKYNRRKSNFSVKTYQKEN